MSRMTSLRAPAAGGRAPRCANNPERMFPLQESERPGRRTPGEARAMAVCAVCPVLVECRRAVLGLGGTAPLAYGVAGGMTREDRRAVRAASRHLPREVVAGPGLAQDRRVAGSARSPRGVGCGVSAMNPRPLAAAALGGVATDA